MLRINDDAARSRAIAEEEVVGFHEKLPVQLLLAGLLTVGVVAASTPVVGIVTAQGNFKLNGLEMVRNANVGSGVLVETQQASANLALSGARVMLASQSRAKVLDGGVVLESGKCQLSSGEAFRLQAFDFRIAEAPGSEAVVSVNGPKAISVTALRGRVRVLNGSGALLANVMPGAALSFSDVGTKGGASSISGVLRYEGSRFLLNDETTNVRYEVRGAQMASHAGQHVEADGVISTDGNNRVLTASSLRIAPGASLHSAMQIGQAPGMGTHLIITILDGEGALNNVTSRVAREPVVQVEDENHKKIEGAYVKFTLPSAGPGVTSGAGSVVTVVTDANGIARLKGLKTSSEAGAYVILVEVAFQGATAQAEIHQTTTTAASTGAGASAGTVASANTKAIIIGVAVAAGLAGTATGLAATAGNGVSSTSP